MKLKPIQTSGTSDGEVYNLNIAFSDQHVVCLEGLSHKDMLELKSCIDCMLMEDEDGIGTTT